MMGETYAIAAALAYALAGVSIMKGRATARGDNGLFLSILATLALSLAIWLRWGQVGVEALGAVGAVRALTIFAVAGFASIVLGRSTMYLATERIGAVRSSLLRRLTPVMAVPCAFLLLGERPGWSVWVGGTFVLTAVYVYLRRSARPTGGIAASGVIIAIASAFFYALSYALRGLGLAILPDAALGALVGAFAGCLWFVAVSILRKGPTKGIRGLIADRGPWQLVTALSLSAGQLLQFFALKTASVAAVAVLGSLDVLFSALLVMALRVAEPIPATRLFLALALALTGTGLMVFS